MTRAQAQSNPVYQAMSAALKQVEVAQQAGSTQPGMKNAADAEVRDKIGQLLLKATAMSKNTPAIKDDANKRWPRLAKPRIRP